MMDMLTSKASATVDTKVAISAHNSQAVPFVFTAISALGAILGFALIVLDKELWWPPFAISVASGAAAFYLWLNAQRAASMPNPLPVMMQTEARSLTFDPRTVGATETVNLIGSFFKQAALRQEVPPAGGVVVNAATGPVPNSETLANERVKSINMQTAAALEQLNRTVEQRLSSTPAIMQPVDTVTPPETHQ